MTTATARYIAIPDGDLQIEVNGRVYPVTVWITHLHTGLQTSAVDVDFESARDTAMEDMFRRIRRASL